jgi:hypothetical protein
MVYTQKPMGIRCSVLPLPVGTGRPRPPLSKKSIDFDHEIMNLFEKNVGTPAILGKTLKVEVELGLNTTTIILPEDLQWPLESFLTVTVSSYTIDPMH